MQRLAAQAQSLFECQNLLLWVMSEEGVAEVVFSTLPELVNETFRAPDADTLRVRLEQGDAARRLLPLAFRNRMVLEGSCFSVLAVSHHARSGLLACWAEEAKIPQNISLLADVLGDSWQKTAAKLHDDKQSQIAQLKLLDVVSAVPEGIIIISNGSLQPSLVNGAAAKRLSLPPGYVDRKLLSDRLYHFFEQADNAALFRAELDRVLSGENHGIEQFLLRFSATDEVLALTFSVAGPESVGDWVWLISDVTDAVNKERELNESRRLAVMQNEAKSDFLANMSHEIRTPMNGVIGMTQALLMTDLSGDQRSYVGTIKRSADVLLNIINDILDLSKIEAGKMSLELLPIDLEELQQDVVRLHQSAANRKGLSLNAQSLSGHPCLNSLVGDPTRLTQVLNNLVSNAIKFTSQGSVTIATTVVSEGPSEMYIRFSVSDTGIGMTAEQLASAFTRYAQADKTISRKFGGTGLGISICKQLVELMKGELGVRSEPGVGSEFWFTVPFGKQPERVIKAEREFVPSVVPVLPKKFNGRVLVAEDNSTNQLLIRVLLEKAGISVDIVDNGLEATLAISRQRYDLIFMDIQMPEMDGFEATKEIRSMEATLSGTRTPIIALTAGSIDLGTADYLEAGMDGYMTKPFTFDLLCETLSKWLDAQ